MTKPLFIGKRDKVTGLTTYCNKCCTDVAEFCKQTGKALERCPNGERHVFKIYAHIPGTRNKRMTKILQTRDIQEAKKIAIQFLEEVKKAGHQPLDLPIIKGGNNVVGVAKADAVPHLLIEALARHISWLKNENVPQFEQKERSEDHVKDVQRAYDLMLECLQKNGHDVLRLPVGAIDKQMVGQVYTYMLEERKFANRTLNKHIGFYSGFFSWYGEEFDIPVKNIFEKVSRKKVAHNPQAITHKEFEALLERITPENGEKITYVKDEKKVRSVFRPWLKNAFEIALLSGRRREEITKLKYSNIIEDGEGNSFIKIDDFKVNRSQQRTTEAEKKIIYIPVTAELCRLLNDLGYERYKGTDTYIIAPEIKDRTHGMMDALSNGFTHYYSQLNTGRELTFKCLRKTYITQMEIFLGKGNAKSITKHSDDAVIEEHYLDKKQLAIAAQSFQVFSKEAGRKNELLETRDNAEKYKEAGHEK